MSRAFVDRICYLGGLILNAQLNTLNGHTIGMQGRYASHMEARHYPALRLQVKCLYCNANAHGQRCGMLKTRIITKYTMSRLANALSATYTGTLASIKIKNEDLPITVLYTNTNQLF